MNTIELGSYKLLNAKALLKHVDWLELTNQEWDSPNKQQWFKDIEQLIRDNQDDIDWENVLFSTPAWSKAFVQEFKHKVDWIKVHNDPFIAEQHKQLFKQEIKEAFDKQQ